MFAENGIENLSYTQVGIGFATLLCFLQAIALVLQIAGARKAQRREVSFETVFASKESVDEVRGEVRAVKVDVMKLKDDIIRNGETRRMAIEGKVEETRQEQRESAAALQQEIRRGEVGRGEAERRNRNDQPEPGAPDIEREQDR
jgi:hypothetical protein